MLRGHILQLPQSVPDMDWRALAGRMGVVGSVSHGADKVAVAMPHPPKTSRGGLLLPDSLSGDCRADVGYVVGHSGIGRTVRGIRIAPPAVGSLVCVWPEDGIWLEGAEIAGGRSDVQIRVYGVFDSGGPEVCDWWDSIVCEMDNEKLVPFGDKIVLRLDPVVESDGGVAIPDIVQVRTGMADVLSVGPLEFDVRPGDRVCYNSNLLLEHGLRVDRADLAICDSRAILYTTTVETETVGVCA